MPNAHFCFLGTSTTHKNAAFLSSKQLFYREADTTGHLSVYKKTERLIDELNLKWPFLESWLSSSSPKKALHNEWSAKVLQQPCGELEWNCKSWCKIQLKLLIWHLVHLSLEQLVFFLVKFWSTGSSKWKHFFDSIQVTNLKYYKFKIVHTVFFVKEAI